MTNPPPFTLDGIAPAAGCTVDEPADGSTPTVAVSTSPVVPFTIGPFPAGGTLAETITDQYTALTGRLVVNKNVSGTAAGSRGDITLAVSCTDGTTNSITLPSGAPLSPLTVGPVPFGTACQVTEPNTGTAGGVIVDGPTFNPGAVVTINQPVVVVTVSNAYHIAPATVELVKQFDGPAAADRGTVRLRWTCGDQDTTFDIPPGTPSPVTVTATEVEAGTVCRAIELNNGATSGITVTTAFEPASQAVAAVAGQTVTVTATNTYAAIPTGDLRIETILTGPAEPRRDTVEIQVTCDSGRTIRLTTPPGRAPDPALIGGLPAGSHCTVGQPLDGDTSSILTATSGLPTDPVDVATDETATVRITNTYTDSVSPPPTSSPPPHHITS